MEYSAALQHIVCCIHMFAKEQDIKCDWARYVTKVVLYHQDFITRRVV